MSCRRAGPSFHRLIVHIADRASVSMYMLDRVGLVGPPCVTSRLILAVVGMSRLEADRAMFTSYLRVSSLVKWLKSTLIPFQRSMVQPTAGRPQCHEKLRQSIRTNFKHLITHHILAGCASVWQILD